MAEKLAGIVGIRKTISSGIGVIGRIVAGAAVLKIVSEVAKMPLHGAVGYIVEAYQTLMHPIIDRTFGLIADPFGYELLPVTKNIIVFYGIFGAAIARRNLAAMNAAGEAPAPRNYVLPGLLWPPIFLIYIIALFIGLFATIPDRSILRNLAAREIKGIAVELLIIAAIVLGAMAAIKADVL